MYKHECMYTVCTSFILDTGIQFEMWDVVKEEGKEARKGWPSPPPPPPPPPPSYSQSPSSPSPYTGGNPSSLWGYRCCCPSSAVVSAVASVVELLPPIFGCSRTLSKKYSKFPQYNMKCRGKLDTTVPEIFCVYHVFPATFNVLSRKIEYLSNRNRTTVCNGKRSYCRSRP